MSPKRPTLKDIATRLDLSIPTVSRALAGHPDISDETQARVREAARELGYPLGERAQPTSVSPRRLIALIVPEINMFFSPALLTGLTRVLQQHDYSLVLHQSENSFSRERELVEQCVRLAPDGVLLQWVHLYETDPSAICSVVATVGEVEKALLDRLEQFSRLQPEDFGGILQVHLVSTLLAMRTSCSGSNCDGLVVGTAKARPPTSKAR